MTSLFLLLQKYVLASRHLLKQAAKFWPQLEMDGVLNIWILKPGNKSRGRGIILVNKQDDILAKINPTNKTSDARFVVQKYIGQFFFEFLRDFFVKVTKKCGL